MQNKCVDCRWYMQYYIKKATGFARIEKGHCVNLIRKNFKPSPCSFWEANIHDQEKQQKTIFDILEKIKERLDNIASVLKNGEE